jgi:hypothetical protein
MNLESESESEDEQPTNPALVNAAAPQPGIPVGIPDGIPVVPSQAAVPSESSAPSEHAVPPAPAPPGEDARAEETSDGSTASREVNKKVKVFVVGSWLSCVAALKVPGIVNGVNTSKTMWFKFRVPMYKALDDGLVEKIGENCYLTHKTVNENKRVPTGSRFADNNSAAAGMLWGEVRVLRDGLKAMQMLNEGHSKAYDSAEISDVMVSVTRSDLCIQTITGLKREIDELQSELLQARRQVFVDVD